MHYSRRELRPKSHFLLRQCAVKPHLGGEIPEQSVRLVFPAAPAQIAGPVVVFG